MRPIAASAARRYHTWRAATVHRRKVAMQPTGPGLDEATRREALAFLGDLVAGYRDLRWHEAYARVTGRSSPHYLPDDILHALALPALIPGDRAAMLADKNLFDRFEGWPSLPATVGRLMNGRLLDAHFRPATVAELMRHLPSDAQLVVKPSRAAGAPGTVVFVESAGLAGALDGRSEAIIQLPVPQHRDLAVLNASSVNTLCVTTYRKIDGEVIHLGTFLRMGRAGSRVDDGLCCGVDGERGVLRADAFGRDGARVYQAHPDNGLLFAERKVPGFAAAREACIAAHRQTPWIDLASWGVAIDTTSRPIAIGVDGGGDLGAAQLACGPLFEPVAGDLRQRIGKRLYSRVLGFI